MRKLLLTVATGCLLTTAAHAITLSLNCVPYEYSIHIEGQQPYLQDVHSDAFTINMDTDAAYSFMGAQFSIKIFDASVAGFGPNNEDVAHGNLNTFSINRYNGQFNYTRMKDGKLTMMIKAQCTNAVKQF
jgi:hypothetical protein